MTRDDVKELAAQVPLGSTATFPCPFCIQAWRAEGKPITWRPTRSFSITRENTGVLYHCFRASCTRSSGFIPDVRFEHIKKRLFKPRMYNFPLEELPKDNVLVPRGFTYEELTKAGVRYNPERESYVFDIRDCYGRTCGVVDRDFTGQRSVKAISYWFNDTVKLHFSLCTEVQEHPLLIVEDIPSAIKASRFINTVALLSSHINLEQIQHIRKLTNTVYLALDEDATDKAIKLQKKYGFYFRNFMVIPLSKDVKDMNEKELEEFQERL